MQRKAALDLQMEQLQPNKAASAAAAAAELAAAASVHQTYPYGIPEHLLQQEQQQQQQADNAEGYTEQLQNGGGEADCHAAEDHQLDDQCIAASLEAAAAWRSEGLVETLPPHANTTVLEQQLQQQLSSIQAQHGQKDSSQLQPAAAAVAQSELHVTWQEEPATQHLAVAAAVDSSAGAYAAASGHGGWHGLIVDCRSPGDRTPDSEQHDEDAQASLLLQRPNTGKYPAAQRCANMLATYLLSSPIAMQWLLGRVVRRGANYVTVISENVLTQPQQSGLQRCLLCRVCVPQSRNSSWQAVHSRATRHVFYSRGRQHAAQRQAHNNLQRSACKQQYSRSCWQQQWRRCAGCSDCRGTGSWSCQWQVYC
jgi:hypothetical protein